VTSRRRAVDIVGGEVDSFLCRRGEIMVAATEIEMKALVDVLRCAFVELQKVKVR
jgi:hypothetical protein